ncbi:MAG: autotransporter outer membrane beta-barrel domain-containing protein [Saprospiraceae bacterium]
MDRFDDIWKNRFNEEDFSDSDWNTPDEDVWEGILPHVDPEKDKRSLWMIWLGLGIGISILLISILTLNKNSQISTNELDSFGTLISETTEPSNTITTNGIGNNISNPNQEPLTNKSTQIINEALTINVSPTKTNKINSSNTYLKSKTQTVFNSTISTDLTPTEINSERNGTSTLSTSKKLENVILEDGMKNKIFEENLISIPSLNMFLSVDNFVHPIHISPEFETKDKRMFSFGFRTGATFWKHRISNDYTSDLSPFDFNYQDGLGWQASFSLNYELNNYFDVFANLQYEQVKTTSGHNSNLTYSVLEEDNSSDPLNGYALSLATPYGLSGATFNFNRGQALASDEVNLLVDFNSEHMIRNLSIPVGVAIYPFGKNQKFIPSARLGFGVNYLAQISNKIQSIETHHDAIQYDDSGSSTFVSPDLEKWHFDYRLGLGLKYELQRNLHLQVNYDWTRGLNPIYKFENYETRIDRHQVSIGLTRSFNP